jgi:hypothetical protein
MEVVVNYQTLTSGTASSGNDFVAAAGTVTFAAGQRTATVSVNVLGDTAVEANETVQVQFSGSRLVASVTATGTIANDDIDPATAPRTFVLTTGVDNYVGGLGDDVFNAAVGSDGSGAAANTLGALDVLNGGAGRDTLNLQTTPDHNTQLLGSVSNIEVVNVSGANYMAGRFAAHEAAKADLVTAQANYVVAERDLDAARDVYNNLTQTRPIHGLNNPYSDQEWIDNLVLLARDKVVDNGSEADAEVAKAVVEAAGQSNATPFTVLAAAEAAYDKYVEAELAAWDARDNAEDAEDAAELALRDNHIDASFFGGSEQIWLVGAESNNGGVENVTTQAVGLRNMTAVDVEAHYGAAVTAGTIALDNARGRVEVDGAKLATVNFAGSVAQSGDKTVTLVDFASGNNLSTVKTVNIAGVTNNGSFDLRAVAGLTTVTGGTASDRVILDDSQMNGTKKPSIDLGGGTNTLAISEQTDNVFEFNGTSSPVLNELSALNFDNVKNAQTIQFLDGVVTTGTFDWNLAKLTAAGMNTLAFSDFQGNNNVRLNNAPTDLKITSVNDFDLSDKTLSGNFTTLDIKADDSVRFAFRDKNSSTESVSNLRDVTVHAGASSLSWDAEVYFRNGDQINAYANLKNVEVSSDENAQLKFINNNGRNYASELQSVKMDVGYWAEMEFDNGEGDNFMSSLTSISATSDMSADEIKLRFKNTNAELFMQSLEDLSVNVDGEINVQLTNSDGAHFMASLEAINLTATDEDGNSANGASTGDINLEIDNNRGEHFLSALRSITVNAADDARVFIDRLEGIESLRSLASIAVTAVDDLRFEIAGYTQVYVHPNWVPGVSDHIVGDTLKSLETITLATNSDIEARIHGVSSDAFDITMSTSTEKDMVVAPRGGMFNFAQSDVVPLLLRNQTDADSVLLVEHAPGLRSIVATGWDSLIILEDANTDLETIDIRGIVDTVEVDVSQADFSQGFTVKIGSTDFVDYYAEGGDVTEIFQFHSRDMGSVWIDDFDAGNTNGDVLDFSVLGLTANNLVVTSANSGNDLRIESVEFSGSIYLVGVANIGDLSGNILFA